MNSRKLPSDKYGYLLWLSEYNESRFYMGTGAGGQMLMIIPDLNMILVTTGLTNLSEERLTTNSLKIQSILTDFIQFHLEHIDSR